MEQARVDTDMPIMPDRHAKEQRILVREACTMHADRCRAILLRWMSRELDPSMDVRPHLVRRNFPKKSGTWMPPTLVLRTPLHAPQYINVSSNHTLAVASHPNPWTVLYVRCARDNEIVAHLSGVYCIYVYVVHGQKAPHHVRACVLFSTYPAYIEAVSLGMA
jgi:hypothetical protein